jgi:hypothetical protein
MNRRRLLVAAVLVAAAATTLLAPAASAAPKLRSAADAKTYLASMGIDARTVVVQRGTRNYAGPNCPGKGWNCTAAKRVLQIGNDNKAECTPSDAPPPSLVVTATSISCTIDQHGPNNEAKCVQRLMTDAAAETCTITQTGVQNKATVDQAVEANGGPTQSASQAASVTQMASGGNNTMNVRQHVHQHTHAAGGQAQDIHQNLTSTQNATGSGNNSSDVRQDQNQDAHNGTTQSQNATSPSGVTACFTFPSLDPNQCVNITQTAVNGNNSNRLDQSIDEDMESNAATSQQQGSLAGGVNGQVELSSTNGRSTNDAKQEKSQTAKAKNATQSQTDPMGCCSFSADGNAQSKETIDQSSTQNASSGAASQELTINGSASSPLGSCSIVQHARNNGASSNTPASASPCPALMLVTHCEGAFVGEGGPEPAFCDSFTPEPESDSAGRRPL